MEWWSCDTGMENYMEDIEESYIGDIQELYTRLLDTRVSSSYVKKD